MKCPHCDHEHACPADPPAMESAENVHHRLGARVLAGRLGLIARAGLVVKRNKTACVPCAGGVCEIPRPKSKAKNPP